MDRWLPRFQIVFAVLFAAAALCGPLVFAQAHLALLAAILAGILLGGVTFLTGWRLVVQKRRVVYPFSAWSANILRRFLSPQQARALKSARGELSPQVRHMLGFASLAIGSVMVVAMVIVAVLVL